MSLGPVSTYYEAVCPELLSPDPDLLHWKLTWRLLLQTWETLAVA